MTGLFFTIARLRKRPPTGAVTCRTQQRNLHRHSVDCWRRFAVSDCPSKI